MKSHETNGGQQSGTSWAFELGNEQQICPIVIEDLERPGHMLIEVYFVDIYVCVELLCSTEWAFSHVFCCQYGSISGDTLATENLAKSLVCVWTVHIRDWPYMSLSLKWTIHIRPSISGGFLLPIHLEIH